LTKLTAKSLFIKISKIS